MSRSAEQLVGLVADANVLIDYAIVDQAILALISQHMGGLHVPSPVLDETSQLTAADAAKLGIEIVEPSLEQVMEASESDGTTSFQDRLCLMLARDHGWALLTNDRALRKECQAGDIKCIWGLEAMAILVESGDLAAKRAVTIAKKIGEVNHFITGRILKQFQVRVGT